MRTRQHGSQNEFSVAQKYASLHFSSFTLQSFEIVMLLLIFAQHAFPHSYFSTYPHPSLSSNYACPL